MVKFDVKRIKDERKDLVSEWEKHKFNTLVEKGFTTEDLANYDIKLEDTINSLITFDRWLELYGVTFGYNLDEYIITEEKQEINIGKILVENGYRLERVIHNVTQYRNVVLDDFTFMDLLDGDLLEDTIDVDFSESEEYFTLFKDHDIICDCVNETKINNIIKDIVFENVDLI